MVDIDYTTYYGERESCEDVIITKIDPEEVGRYISQSIFDQAKIDLGEAYMPWEITYLYDGGEYESLYSAVTDNLDKVLVYNDGMIKGYSEMQYAKNTSLLYADPSFYTSNAKYFVSTVYASYEIDPAREFRCVNEYSETKYSY